MVKEGEPFLARVKVSLRIETVVEIVDSGYLGISATVKEHVRRAENIVNTWQWLVKKGTNEPEQIGVRQKVIGVTIIPEENP